MSCDDVPPDQAAIERVEQDMHAAIADRRAGFQSREKHFNPHDAGEALSACKEVFEAHGRRFFLDRGTLLGAVRENGFISSDYDIDVGIFADEVSLDDIKTMFHDTAFHLSQDFEYKVGLISPAGIHVDFFLTTREHGYFLSKGFRSIHHWYFTPFELMEYEFLGSTFLIPDNFEKHLDENYGNWRDSALFYDLSYDEPCVAHSRSAATLNYLTRRMSKGLRSGNRFEAEAPIEPLHQVFGLDFRAHFPTAAAIVEPGANGPRRSAPIVVVASFDDYSFSLSRIIESALSISDDVQLVVATNSCASIADSMSIAESVDRVSGVHAVDDVNLDALEAAIGVAPRAVVTRDGITTAITTTSDRRTDIVVYDDRSVALTVGSDGRIGVRQRATGEQV